MLDGTPVLDLKPYIPHYDNPAQLNLEYSDGVQTDRDRLELDGQESEEESRVPSASTVQPSPAEVVQARLSEREAPDGEEGHLVGPSPPTSLHHRSISPLPTHVCRIDPL